MTPQFRLFSYGHTKWSVFLSSSLLTEKFEERGDILELIETTSDKDEESFIALFKIFIFKRMMS